MKQYIIMVAGAALLSAFADMVSPDNWRKYIKIITGLVVLAVMINPIMKLKNIDLFADFSLDDRIVEVQNNNNKKAVQDELVNRVQKDAEDRIKTEFNVDAKVKTKILVNDKNEIEGVDKIYVYTDKNVRGIQKRLAEVYGLQEKEVIVGYE